MISKSGRVASQPGWVAIGFGISILLSAIFASPSPAAGPSQQQQLVDKSRLTLESFAADPGMQDALKNLSQEARALFIIPQFMRGAFIFGGAGGSGVLLVRDDKTGKWGVPVFYNIGSASFGLQAGADVSEMVLVVRTKKGLEEFYSNDFKLGANAGIAAGPVGVGASAHGIAADIIAYAKKKGAFGGLAVEGAFVSVSNESNRAYYGKSVTPADLIVKKEVGNPKSIDLRNTAARLMK